MSDAQKDIFNPDYNAPASRNVVPWYGLDWNDFSQDLRDKFFKHLRSMPHNRAVGYLKYLSNHQQFPKWNSQIWVGVLKEIEENDRRDSD